MTEIGQHVWLRFGTGCPRRLFAFYLWQFTTTRRPKPTLLSARVTPNLFIISTHYIPNDQMTCKPPSRKTPVFHFMGQFRLWELRWCIRLDSETKSSPSEQPSQGGTTDNTHVDAIAIWCKYLRGRLLQAEPNYLANSNTLVLAVSSCKFFLRSPKTSAHLSWLGPVTTPSWYYTWKMKYATILKISHPTYVHVLFYSSTSTC